ncbi:MAG: UDP-N-acetylmuramoyl-L-alanine--D-glutamate ligase [Thermodesulfobacteriota bacterium]
MDLSQKRITVLGLGKSGLAAARWLDGEGARVTASEIRRREELDPEFLQAISGLGIQLETGGHREETLLGSDMIVISPGVPADLPVLKKAAAKGIPILGEMELASRLIRVPVVAVTGTNGKSTVTEFLGSVIRAAGFRVFVGGNLGTPFMECVAQARSLDYAVVEVSSFQLDTAETFCPQVAVLLNITPDHLDRYPGYGAYEESKLRIFQNQGRGQFAVLNDEDPRLAAFHPKGGATVLRYGIERREHRQAWMEGKRLIAAVPGKDLVRLDLHRFRLQGRHNLENLMAVVLAGLALGIDRSVLQNGIDRFPGLPHRIEWVGDVRGIAFYDDSKATNVDAALRSVLSFDRPVILIAGGRHKGADYAPLVEAAQGRLRKAVFLGEARSLLAASFEGRIPFTLAEDMRDAVAQAFAAARKGDAVLLAPACSSFDMFIDYAHRGRVFREAVEGLRGRAE